MEPACAVIGGIADEEDQPPTGKGGALETFGEEAPADPLTLAAKVDGKRPQQQGRVWAEADRPVADRTHEACVLVACDQAQAPGRGDPNAVAVGDLAPTILAEGEIEEGLDVGTVIRLLEIDGEQRLGLGRAKGGRLAPRPPSLKRRRAGERRRRVVHVVVGRWSTLR